MKKIFLIVICVFLVSCDLGIKETPYEYPDEGMEAEGTFETYDDGVSFSYPEKFKVKVDAKVPGNHYTFTIENKKKDTSIIHLNARRMAGIKQAEELALKRQGELSDDYAIEQETAPYMEEMGYTRYFISDVVQETIEFDKKTVYMTKCVMDLDPQRILISYYNWAEGDFYCTLRLISYERDFRRDNPASKKLVESFKVK